jgi:predicted ATPase
VIQRLYIHNFRCLENFELPIGRMPSSLLIGKNGTGKSTIGIALEILQSIGRGINRVGQLIKSIDFARGRSDSPIRLEIEVLLQGKLYKYVLAFELPETFKECRIFEEELTVDGTPIYSRQRAQVTLYKSPKNYEAKFLVDWHLVALPVIQEQSDADPLHIFKMWISRMIILDPIPSMMTGESAGENLEPKRDGSNFGEWFSGLLVRSPAAYTQIDKYLRELMPDFKDFQNETIGKDAKSMNVRFQSENNRALMAINFRDVSAGEKCFFLSAVLLAANSFYGPLFCFWDEPDNYLSLSEIGHFIVALRRSFETGGQIMMTSHHAEGIRKFSHENTLVLFRKSHLEPTVVRPLSELSVQGDLVDTLIRDDLNNAT